MHILITGGTGLIGSNLVPLLQPHKITVLTRDIAKATKILGTSVDYLSSLQELSDLNHFDILINLAGEPIADKKWSHKQKDRIEQSRWTITQQLVSLIQASDNPPNLFISGSAIGYYGRQQDQVIDESFTDNHVEFSQQLCQKWESIAQQAASQQTRVCILRTGIVMTKKGGALKKMLLPFQLGLGGPIGRGQQYMPWIHLQDMLQGIIHLIDTPSCQGQYNFTAPNPVTNQEFSQALAASLRRPCLFRVPEFVLKALMGEMADLVIYGQRVVPTRLLESGYDFSYQQIDQALSDLVK
jgi:uncharacterized protein (TIGR01777 family)